MAPLGMRDYPASVLLDHLLSACYKDAGGSCILKCNCGRHLVAEVVLREDSKYRRHAEPQSTKPLI